jgi:hypothetical protein
MRCAALFCLCLLVPAGTIQAGEAEPMALLFTSFRGNGQDGLHLATSDDGYAWRALNGDRPVLASKVGGGLMRDPSLCRAPDGTFHLVWTTGWTRYGLGYASSRDLKTWTEPRLIEVMAHEPATRNVWAPDLFYDAATGQFVIVWASTIPGRFAAGASQGDDGYNHRLYATSTTDFQTFTPTKLFYDPGFNVIDGTIVQVGDRYLLILKDETRNPPAKNLRVAEATAAMGPYGPPSAPITGNYWAEGPSAIRINGRWHVYFDRYIERRYGLVTSPDLRGDWNDESDRVSFPKDFRHGTVLWVPKRLVDAFDPAPNARGEARP